MFGWILENPVEGDRGTMLPWDDASISVDLSWEVGNLSPKTVQGLALALESIDDIHCSNSLAASMLRVGDRITDHILQEDLEHTTSFAPPFPRPLPPFPRPDILNCWLVFLRRNSFKN